MLKLQRRFGGLSKDAASPNSFSLNSIQLKFYSNLAVSLLVGWHQCLLPNTAFLLNNVPGRPATSLALPYNLIFPFIIKTSGLLRFRHRTGTAEAWARSLSKLDERLPRAGAHHAPLSGPHVKVKGCPNRGTAIPFSLFCQ